MFSNVSIFLGRTPFIRLLLPLTAGMLLQWYCPLSAPMLYVGLAVAALSLLFFLLIPLFNRYRLVWIAGLLLHLLIAFTGALLLFHKDARHASGWYGRFYQPGDAVLLSLAEPLSEKANSWKAIAEVCYVLKKDKSIRCTGHVIIYFKKDSLPAGLSYGSCILTASALQGIRNSGNPGGFDYNRYCLFQGITGQVFPDKNDFIAPGKIESSLQRFLFTARANVLRSIRTYIKSKKESGLAEALLIGYKDDLDSDLLQSYSHTGVVHIIAVSGMHLALIYCILNFLLQPLQKKKATRWLGPLLVIGMLWLFSLVTGGAPSIVRAAVMLTCVMLGNSFSRKSNIYNTIAASAFLLLCYDPFWLWDAGFQLSYSAVLSIVIYYRPIYTLLYIKNRVVDWGWQLVAVSLAAQLLTTPFSIYYFHQFPVYFLLTNLLAVPLSSIILIGELALLAIGLIPLLAGWIGQLLESMIRLMNTLIEQVERLPFALWEGLQISIPQAILLLCLLAAFSCWLMEKIKPALMAGLICLSGFLLLRAADFYKAGRQQKIIIYNIPKRTAIDMIDGRHFIFLGDTGCQADGFIRRFHLQPARSLYRTTIAPPSLVYQKEHIGRFRDKTILFLDSTVSIRENTFKPVIDLLVISGRPSLQINDLAACLTVRQVVADASVPSWKSRRWQQDCAALHIPYYSVNEQGAFVMNIR